jgi:ribosome recycling factor
VAITDELLADAKDRMAKSVESSRGELATVRTGRASPHLLDRIQVDYYGAQTPLNQLANVAASEARLLTVTPFDKSAVGAIEKAILESDVGLTPSNDGNVIRLAIPPLTEERRRDLAKTARGRAEDAKVAIRNVRRDGKEQIKRSFEADKLPEDMRFEAEEQLQKLTDAHIAKVDAMLQQKEKEIMAV